MLSERLYPWGKSAKMQAAQVYHHPGRSDPFNLKQEVYAGLEPILTSRHFATQYPAFLGKDTTNDQDSN